MTLSKVGMAAESKHYNVGDIQPIDLIVSQKLDFMEGSIVKYVCRWRRKGTPVQDLEKAKQYLDWLLEIEREKNENSNNKSN